MNRRLFFALWPAPDQRQQLTEATQATLERVEGRQIPATNHHLTLAFLGRVADDRLEALRTLANEVARQPLAAGLPIEVVLDALEHWRKAEIVCATASAPSAGAAELAAGLQQTLTRGGFVPDLKPFRPHVTLVRKVSRVSHDLVMDSVRWSFDAMTLVESRTTPRGSLYSVLDSWPLSGERNL